MRRALWICLEVRYRRPSTRGRPWPDWDPASKLGEKSESLQSTHKNERKPILDRKRLVPPGRRWSPFRVGFRFPVGGPRDVQGFRVAQVQSPGVPHALLEVRT